MNKYERGHQLDRRMILDVLDGKPLSWIEHYDTESYRGANEERDEYDLVTFDWNGRQFSKPKWKHLTRSELYALIGEEV